MRTVARLSITPVKSTALVHPREIRLERHGAVANRVFYVIREDGRLFDATSHGPLVQVRSNYDPDAERLSLQFPDGSVAEGDASALAEPVETNFFGRPVRGHRLDGPWSDALSGHVGRPVGLIRCDDPGAGNDVHPVTLVSTASVDELARRAGHDGTLDPRRFRMLMEIDGCLPHEEDTWSNRSVRIGEVVVRVLGPVPRCVVTTQSPATGHKDFDTLRHIRAYRGRGRGNSIDFGMYGLVEVPGTVRVGDRVDALLDRAPSVQPAQRGSGI
jgi:uncharacterized protein YcbX